MSIGYQTCLLDICIELPYSITDMSLFLVWRFPGNFVIDAFHLFPFASEFRITWRFKFPRSVCRRLLMCSFCIPHNKILSSYTIVYIRVLLLVLAVGLWSLEFFQKKVAFNFDILRIIPLRSYILTGIICNMYVCPFYLTNCTMWW